jgi:hypothetical protein
MKTLSARFTFVILSGIALVTLLSCCDQKLATDQDYSFRLKVGKTKDDFVDLRPRDGQDALDAALRPLDTKQYKIRLKSNIGDIIEDYHPHDQASMKTDKVMKSEAANSGTRSESAANDPNITYHVYSNNLDDIRAVVAALSPTPAPSH